MGYGFGPGHNKPAKKPVQEHPKGKPPVHQKPGAPEKTQKPVKPAFPFDLGQFFKGNYGKKK